MEPVFRLVETLKHYSLAPTLLDHCCLASVWWPLMPGWTTVEKLQLDWTISSWLQPGWASCVWLQVGPWLSGVCWLNHCCQTVDWLDHSWLVGPLLCGFSLALSLAASFNWQDYWCLTWFEYGWLAVFRVDHCCVWCSMAGPLLSDCCFAVPQMLGFSLVETMVPGCSLAELLLS